MTLFVNVYVPEWCVRMCGAILTPGPFVFIRVTHVYSPPTARLLIASNSAH